MDKMAKQMDQSELQKISQYFGDNCEVVCAFRKDSSVKEDIEQAQSISTILKRRAMTLDDILTVTGLSLHKAKKTLRTLELTGKIKSFHFGDSLFFISEE